MVGAPARGCAAASQALAAHSVAQLRQEGGELGLQLVHADKKRVEEVADSTLAFMLACCATREELPDHGRRLAWPRPLRMQGHAPLQRPRGGMVGCPVAVSSLAFRMLVDFFASEVMVLPSKSPATLSRSLSNPSPLSDLVTHIGFLRGFLRITLEPGGQFELSGASMKDLLQAVKKELESHLKQVNAVGKEVGLEFAGMGYDPKWSTEFKFINQLCIFTNDSLRIIDM